MCRRTYAAKGFREGVVSSFLLILDLPGCFPMLLCNVDVSNQIGFFLILGCLKFLHVPDQTIVFCFQVFDLLLHIDNCRTDKFEFFVNNENNNILVCQLLSSRINVESQVFCNNTFLLGILKSRFKFLVVDLF